MYPGKSKAWYYFSNMHNDNKIDEGLNLLEIILDYNVTTAAVDRVDQLCYNYSGQKRAKR